jgi:ankyrin repeat protein
MQVELPLFEAVLTGDCSRIDSLLAAGSDVNVTTVGDKWNLLHTALAGVTEAPEPKVVRQLIEHGVDVNAKDRFGWTPLHYAVRSKAPSADTRRWIECIRILVQASADVNSEDNEGITPLHRSILRNPWNLAVAEILLAAGAKTTEVFCRFLNAVASPSKSRLIELLSEYDAMC